MIEPCSVRIRKALSARNMTQSDLCAKAQISKSSLSEYLKGLYEPKQDKIFALALALNVDPVWLMGFDVPMEKTERSQTTIPTNGLFSPLPRMKEWRVLGGTACGDPLHMELEETITAPADIDADYVFRCVGDSMIGARILDGDIVFVKSGEVENGQIGVVRVEDSYSLKRIYHGEDYLELRSENPMYTPIILRGEQINAEIIGRAVCFQSRVI
jgi:repressor LexA